MITNTPMSEAMLEYYETLADDQKLAVQISLSKVLSDEIDKEERKATLEFLRSLGWIIPE